MTVLPKTSMQYLLSTALGPTAQSSAVASVHVTTTEGRVAAQVLDIDKPQKADNGAGRGMDFIPAPEPGGGRPDDADHRGRAGPGATRGPP